MAWRSSKKNAYPFVVDDFTRSALGEAGLGELATNLWPHECQTCGKALASTRPAVRVRAAAAVATATLHHPHCYPARWDDTDGDTGSPATAAATLNFVSHALLIPTVNERTGAEVFRPMLLVNPGLEQVILAERDGGWRVATTDYYAQYGLHAGGAMLRVDNSVIPNAIATLDTTGLVTVRLGDLRAGWSGECDPVLAGRIRELGGIGLAVSTAFHPGLEPLEVFHGFADAIQTGQVAGGWVPLTS